MRRESDGKRNTGIEIEKRKEDRQRETKTEKNIQTDPSDGNSTIERKVFFFCQSYER